MPGTDAREDGEGGLGEVGIRERRAVAGERGLHLGRVEGALHGEADGTGAPVLDLASRLVECVARTGEDGLVGSVQVRDGQAGGAGDLDGELGTAQDGEHAASTPLRCLLHELAAACGEAQAVRVVECAGGGECCELAQRVARRGGGMRTAELLPAGEGRAVDGGLGEAGSVRDMLEGVGADELDRKVEEVGAILGDGVAHALFVASLAREEQRCVGELAHLPIVVQDCVGERLGARTPRSAGYARRVGG